MDKNSNKACFSCFKGMIFQDKTRQDKTRQDNPLVFSRYSNYFKSFSGNIFINFLMEV